MRCRCSCCGAVLLLLRPVLLLVLLVVQLLVHSAVLVHAVHRAVPGWLRAHTAHTAACPKAQPPDGRLARHVLHSTPHRQPHNETVGMSRVSRCRCVCRGGLALNMHPTSQPTSSNRHEVGGGGGTAQQVCCQACVRARRRFVCRPAWQVVLPDTPLMAAPHVPRWAATERTPDSHRRSCWERAPSWVLGGRVCRQDRRRVPGGPWACPLHRQGCRVAAGAKAKAQAGAGTIISAGQQTGL